MGINNQSSILLESGTNELEVLEFIIAGESFGINVAKVQELMQYCEAQPMPRAHPCIEGIFQPRSEVYTILNLAEYLGLPPSNNLEKDIYVITSFNKMKVAFHVHGVENIHRISWGAIEKPDAIIYGGAEGVVTGIAKVGEKIISILDFEKIVFDISPECGIDMSEIDALGERDKSERPILIAEDSMLLRKMLLESLSKAGYTSIIPTNNGADAWRALQEFRDMPGELTEHVACVITDIEMPQMDGHRLTKMIRSDPTLKDLPIIIFSSLIDENMRLKGIELGATAQLSKPEIGNLVAIVDEYIR